MIKFWDTMELNFRSMGDTMWEVEVILVSEAQLKRFANLVGGATSKWHGKAINKHSGWTRFSEGSDMGRKLNAKFDLF